jgi:tetratricopeptide (TPR) repeat protein
VTKGTRLPSSRSRTRLVSFRIVKPMISSSSAVAPKRLDGPVAPVSSHTFGSPQRRTVLCCVLLAAAVLVSYASITKNGFVNYDDNRYISENSHVRAGLTTETFKWAFTTYEQANWHPLTWLSHALDCELFGLNPLGHHSVSVLLHALNAVILFLLLQSATGFSGRSLMVAALFALHPMNVESVAWASERKNVLSMLFFLLALYAHGLYARQPNLHRYFAVTGFFVLALLSKPQVIAFPFLLLLWDYWPLRRIGASSGNSTNLPGDARSYAWLIAEKLPLLLLFAASAVMTVKAQAAGSAVKSLTEYSALLRFETAVVDYVRYLGKALCPSRLVSFYPHPSTLYPLWQVSAAAVVLILVTAIVLLRGRDQRYLVVGWFWFLGSLVPMIGLVQVGLQAMADRYAYLPFVGLFLMVTWLAADWAEARPIPSKWLAVPAISCLLALGALTGRQVGYWHDSGSLWLHTLAFTRDNYVAEENLGAFLSDQGRYDEAAEHFRSALVIRPNGLMANLNLGAYEDRRGNLPAAINHYQRVADNAGDPGMRATAYGSLGFVYRQVGQTAKAQQCFEKSLQSDPNRVRARIGLGLLAQENGKFGEAIRQYSSAAALQPSDVIYLLLAQALQRGGHPEEAKAVYERLASSPNFAEAQKQAALLLAGK